MNIFEDSFITQHPLVQVTLWISIKGKEKAGGRQSFQDIVLCFTFKCIYTYEVSCYSRNTRNMTSWVYNLTYEHKAS